MKYRIVIETEASGKKWYYVQKLYLFYFWCYLTEVRDMSMRAARVGWHSLEEAEAHMQAEIDFAHRKAQQKIVKREYVNPSITIASRTLVDGQMRPSSQ